MITAHSSHEMVLNLQFSLLLAISPLSPVHCFTAGWFLSWCLLISACPGQVPHPYPAFLGSEISGPVGNLGPPVVYDLPQDRDLGHLIKAAVGIGWLQEGDEAAGWKGQERTDVLMH